MKKLMSLLVAASLAACPPPGPTPDGGSGGGDGTGGGTATGGGDATGGGGGQVMGECGEPANESRRQALLAAQPSVETRKKTVLRQTVTFPSEAGDPSVQCEVELSFRDSNGNGTLDDYEDWRKTASERATALLAQLSQPQKLGLMAHAVLNDGTAATLNTATTAALGAEVRFLQEASFVAGNTTSPNTRAAWANAVQEKAEEGALGIPVVLSGENLHTSSNGRVKAYLFSQWPAEAGLGASDDPALLETFGKVVSAEYQAIGLRMALGVPANLATDPRRSDNQFTFGEDPDRVAALLSAYVKGLQGAKLGQGSVAAVVGAFPGAGAAKGGLDARLDKGKALSFTGVNIDQHLKPFESAFSTGAGAVLTSYGVVEAGSWSAKGGAVSGAAIEQVGVSFNKALVTDLLRTSLQFKGLVIAPRGVLENAAVSPLGAPWGVEGSTKAARITKAVEAGVNQFIGLADTTDLAAANLPQAQVDAAATHALELMFSLGLFEDPYVEASTAASKTNTDMAYRAGLDAMNRSLVLLVNTDKPTGFLEAPSKGNAGNGTGKVLPAPPGEAYVAAGCDYYVAGDFDLEYVRGVSVGYGNMTNDAPNVKGTLANTAADKMALSDYIFVRIADPFTVDADSGTLNLPTPLLTYATAANNTTLTPLANARAAVMGWTGAPATQAQIVVIIDAGRLPVLDEVLAFNPAGVYVDWNGTNAERNLSSDKVTLDVMFGIVNGAGKLPMGVPASQTAADAQLPDVPGDGQHPTFVKGFGLTTPRFE